MKNKLFKSFTDKIAFHLKLIPIFPDFTDSERRIICTTLYDICRANPIELFNCLDPLNLNRKEANILYKRLLEIEKCVVNYTESYGNKELLLEYITVCKLSLEKYALK